MSAAQAVKSRPRSELSMALFRPLALAVVRACVAAGVRPEALVVSHFAVGLVAALLIASGSWTAWVAAAVLLQVKTVLDNADGALARTTGAVTELGRYLDTVLDFLVNVALFVALAAHGPAAASALALGVLTLLLSWDFNAERLHSEARPDPAGRVEPESAAAPPGPGPAWLLAAFRGFYLAVFAPQDRLVRSLDERLFRFAGGSDYAPGASERQAWSDYLSTAAVVDLGLSTQLLVLGACLVAGAPFAYALIVLLQGLYLVALQTVRVIRFRRRLRQGARA